MIERREIYRSALPLALTTAAISLMGVVLIASAIKNNPGLQGVWQKQLVLVAAGLVLMVVAALVDYRLLLRLSKPVYVLSLLVLVALAVIGRVAGGARSWLTISGINMQPSELVKIALILSLARSFSRIEKRHLNLADIVGPMALAGAPIILIAAQPDLGTALTLVPLLMGMALVAGLRIRSLVALALIGLVLFSFAWLFVLKDYQKERLYSFLNPGDDPRQSGYQIQQSLIAIGSGGLLGKGLFLGSQSQLNFVPAQHTDFIFSVLGEEMGFLAVALALLLYFALFAKALIPTRDLQDVAGIYIIAGAVSFIAFQALINILMSVGLFPTTGVPLPFLSAGGSSLLTCLITVGLVISVHIHPKKD